MDYRRCFGLRAPRPVGDSTILVPQMENYTLFATPFLDINKKISKFIEEMQQEPGSQSDESAPVKKTGKRGGDKSKGKKAEEDSKKSSQEASQFEVDFGIVLNVATVEQDQLTITFGEGNEIEVKVKQARIKCEYGNIAFSRNCTYKYQLPDNVVKNSLVALRTSDDYLIILPRDHLREDLLKKSIKVVESSVKELVPSEEATGSADLEEKKESEPVASKSQKIKPKKPTSQSKEGKEKPKSKKTSDTKDASDLTAEEAEESSKSELVFLDENCLMPVQVTRMLKPGLDIFMLRKYVSDLESYVSTVRKYIENSSFVSQNSKTAERCIRFIAKTKTGKYYEINGVEDEKEKLARDSSPEGGHGPTIIVSDESTKTEQKVQES